MSARRPSLRSQKASPDSRPRRGTPDETRRRLLAAAGVAFDRDGYEGTDSNRIAREAGYAPGTFYKHFVDKKAAFVAVYAEWVAEEWRALDARFERDDPPREKAEALVAAIVDHHRRWRGLRRNLRALAASDADVRRVYVESRARQLDALAQHDARAGRATPPRADDVLLFYTIERTADAIAEGEPERLGIDEHELRARLVEQVLARLRRLE